MCHRTTVSICLNHCVGKINSCHYTTGKYRLSSTFSPTLNSRYHFAWGHQSLCDCSSYIQPLILQLTSREHYYVIDNRDGIGLGIRNDVIYEKLCLFHFFLYHLHFTTKRLTEVTLCACVVFVSLLKADVLPQSILNLPQYTQNGLQWLTCCQECGALPPGSLKDLYYKQLATCIFTGYNC